MLFFEFRGIGFFIILRFVFDLSLQGVPADIMENHLLCLRTSSAVCEIRVGIPCGRMPIFKSQPFMERVPETFYWVHIQCLC